MPRRGMTLIAVVLLVGAVGSPVLASEGPDARGGWLASVSAWLDQALESVGFQPIFEGSACGVDPNGKSIPCSSSTEIQADTACGVDPNGQPRTCPEV